MDRRDRLPREGRAEQTVRLLAREIRACSRERVGLRGRDGYARFKAGNEKVWPFRRKPTDRRAVRDRSAVAYRVRGNVIIAPVVHATTGLGLEVAPMALGPSPSSADVAAALADALSNSGRIVPHPTQIEWPGFFKPFLEAAGVRSFKAFMADATSVGIDDLGDDLRLTPNRNRGAKEGFAAIVEEALVVPKADGERSAEALLAMLGKDVR
jgi:hypothetical protein